MRTGNRACAGVLISAFLALVPWSGAAANELTSSATDSGVGIPTQYQASYKVLESEVQSFGASASARAHGYRTSTIMGTELLAANGNIGAGLLQAKAIDRVDQELDSFASLDVKGVTVDVAFPLLLSSTPDHAGYLAFYEKVARAVKAHHMMLSVEENPIFSGTPFTSLHIDYGRLTLTSSAAEQRSEAQAIIDDLRPRYLTLLAEPDTRTQAIGVDVDSPSSAVAFVNRVLHQLDRHSTLVGAGTGNWSSPAIDQALATKTKIDYLDVHAYVFGPKALSNLAADVSAARSAHLKLVLDETWLNKPTAGEGTGLQGAPEEMKIKSYSFWEPLDAQFVESMERYAYDQRFSYVSFYDGARAFFAYLPWSASLESASYAQFSRQYNVAVVTNMRAGIVSDPGEVFRRAVQAG